MTERAAFIPFVPKAAQVAAENREEFVRLCREDLLVFGHDLDFDAATWDVSEHFRRRGKPGRTRLHFTQFSGACDKLGPPLPEPLAAFAKAYVRYTWAQKARQSVPWHEIDSFRILAQALSEKDLAADIGSVNAEVLNHAVELAKARWGKVTVAGRADRLSRFVDFLRKNNLTECIHQPWKHGAKSNRDRNRLDKAAKARRASKLPSKEAIDALALAFNLSAEKRDIILTSAMALLVCAPQRLNEIFALPKNCEVEDKVDGGPAFGIRWAGSKRYPDHVKLIPNVFAEVAREAIRRLRKHTEEARHIAAWYEANPGQLYLPADCAHLRGKDLTIYDIIEIIGTRAVSTAHTFLKKFGIERAGVRRPPSKSGRGAPQHVYRFSDVERAIVSLLPNGFPILDPKTKLHYSQAMMVVRRNEFGQDSPWRCMIAPITYQNIQGAFHRTKGGQKNVFERLGISTEGHSIFLTSHQVRHYLNSLANYADVSQIDIAAWSGRVDIRQNKEYDHETAESVMERRRVMERQLVEVRAKRGDVSRLVNITPADPVSRRDITVGGDQLHATGLGYCEHDFASSPCPIFQEHLLCIEHVYIKGHTPVAEVSQALDLARQSLAKARCALSTEVYGAGEWLDAQVETVARLEQLYSILVDPSIPSGTRVRLTKSGRFTLLEQALYDHEIATGEKLLSHPPSAKPLPGPGKDRSDA